ncbi:hypothetical protein ACGFIU_00710 [Rhodococcus oryzae]|uniref:hypothetical protein n=1 Tax=Rhodococcus oryzae TaxID=2571143 RepID=UPI0037141EEB
MTTATTTSSAQQHDATHPAAPSAEQNGIGNTEPAPAGSDASDNHNETNDDPGTGGNAEAAKYRHRLREAEAALSVATERINQFLRAEVQRIAAGKLAEPDDVFTFGPELTDLLATDGEVDTGKVADALHAILTARPGLAAGARPPIVPSHPNFGQGSTGAVARGGTGWDGLLKGSS